MFNNFRSAVAAACLAALPMTAHAAPVTYNFDGPIFTTATGPFSTTDKITGYIEFDDSVFSPTGTASTRAGSSGVTNISSWSFTDGFNTFNNLVTTTSFVINVNFTGFAPTFWNIDTTFGVTNQADIFAYGTPGSHRAASFFQGDCASTPAFFCPGEAYSVTSGQPWSIAPVPVPASALLLGTALLGFAGAARRRSKARG